MFDIQGGQEVRLIFYCNAFSQLRMIDFVTWPPFCIIIIYLLKCPSGKVNLSCENVLQENVNLISWPPLISNILVDYNLASDWPRTFLHPGCFCFFTITGNSSKYYYQDTAICLLYSSIEVNYLKYIST